MPEHLIIIGASVRAAAFSAIRAGFKPWCVDLFADRDLAAVCPARRVPMKTYPRALFEAVDEAPPGPWMYTGGLENHPDLIDDLARRRPLWGNPGRVLRRVRNPFELVRALDKAHVPYPDCEPSPRGLPADGSWLVKPLRGSGGRGIARWHGGPTSGRSCFWQRRLVGNPVSAVYCADERICRLMGHSRQLVGEPALHAAEFEYCGSIALCPTADLALRYKLDVIGDVLAGEFGLRGLFGADMVVVQGEPYVVEVNPRYTSSIEVLEHAAGFAALRLHSAAFGHGRAEMRCVGNDYVGKAVVYAASPRIMPDTGRWVGAPDADPLRRADVPAAGERIDRGRPITTVFAAGASADEVYAGLLAAAAEVEDEIDAAARPAAK